MGFWADVGEALIPSKQDNESNATYRWRQIVAVSIFVMAMAIFGTNALIWGYAKPLYEGVAGRSQVGDIQSQVNDIRLDQILRNLKDARTTECIAQQQGNMIALQAAQNELQKEYQSYYNLMKIEPRIPTCDELILTKNTNNGTGG